MEILDRFILETRGVEKAAAYAETLRSIRRLDVRAFRRSYSCSFEGVVVPVLRMLGDQRARQMEAFVDGKKRSFEPTPGDEPPKKRAKFGDSERDSVMLFYLRNKNPTVKSHAIDARAFLLERGKFYVEMEFSKRYNELKKIIGKLIRLKIVDKVDAEYEFNVVNLPKFFADNLCSRVLLNIMSVFGDRGRLYLGLFKMVDFDSYIGGWGADVLSLAGRGKHIQKEIMLSHVVKVENAAADPDPLYVNPETVGKLMCDWYSSELEFYRERPTGWYAPARGEGSLQMGSTLSESVEVKGLEGWLWGVFSIWHTELADNPDDQTVAAEEVPTELSCFYFPLVFERTVPGLKGLEWKFSVLRKWLEMVEESFYFRWWISPVLSMKKPELEDTMSSICSTARRKFKLEANFHMIDRAAVETMEGVTDVWNDFNERMKGMKKRDEPLPSIY